MCDYVALPLLLMPFGKGLVRTTDCWLSVALPLRARLAASTTSRWPTSNAVPEGGCITTTVCAQGFYLLYSAVLGRC